MGRDSPHLDGNPVLEVVRRGLKLAAPPLDDEDEQRAPIRWLVEHLQHIIIEGEGD
jgi:hypothetical protein